MKPLKPPVIRPGQRVPYRKGTLAQIDERRGFVARLVASGARKMEIHRAVREKFGILWQQCDRYIDFVTAPDTRLTRACAGGALNSSLDEYMRQLKIILDAAEKNPPPFS